MNKVGFLTMEKQGNRKKNTVGSSRIRARWLYDIWEGAEEYRMGADYDVLIFQKVYWEAMMKNFEGIKILDLCDPDWLEGRDVFKFVSMADAVVTSSQRLALHIRKLANVPTVCIPDRVNLNEHTQKHGKHFGRAKNAVWFGYSGNFKYALSCLHHLVAKNVALVGVSDREIKIPTEDEGLDFSFIKFSYPKIHGIVGYADFAILPDPSQHDFRGYFKSNNKVLTAWALGVPVVRAPEDLERFMSGEEREKERQLRSAEIKEKWDVEYSVQEYKDLIQFIGRGESHLIETKFDDRLKTRGII